MSFCRCCAGTTNSARGPHHDLAVSYHSPGGALAAPQRCSPPLAVGLHGQALGESRSAGPTPVEEIERREESLRSTPPWIACRKKYRTVLILSALEESTGEDIAALLAFETNAVWVRLHRARAKLADLLTEENSHERNQTRARSHPA